MANQTTIDVEGIDGARPILSLLESVTTAATRAGYDEHTIDSQALRVPERADIGDGHLIPDFMTDGTGVAGAIRDGSHGLDFRLREAQTGEANREGKSLFTAVAVREDWSIPEVVEHLAETGQLRAATVELADVVRDDVNPANVVIWAVVTYLKGVVAESILTGLDRFSKSGVSNDQNGDDAYDSLNDNDRNGLVQIKCITFDDQRDDHIYYQFDCRGNLHYGDDLREVHNSVVDKCDRVGDTRKGGVEVTGTLTMSAVAQSHYRQEFRPSVTSAQGGTVRYIQW